MILALEIVIGCILILLTSSRMQIWALKDDVDELRKRLDVERRIKNDALHKLRTAMSEITILKATYVRKRGKDGKFIPRPTIQYQPLEDHQSAPSEPAEHQYVLPQG